MTVKRTSHTVYETKYHLVWAPKYRKWILRGDIQQRVAEVLREVAANHDMEIDTMEIAEDHVHLSVSFPPWESIARAVGKFKSISASTILREYPGVKRELWGGHFWQVGCFARTVGDAVTAEVIRRYIQYHQTEETTPKQLRLFKKPRPVAGELHFHPVLSPKSLEWGTELFKNAVEIPSPATDALCKAAREANVYVVMGLCERRPNTTGTMYNTQLFIDRFGCIVGKHQKIQPTIGERLVHTGGFGDTMCAFDTEFGPISGLICGENQNPLALFSLAADSTVIHVSAWPHLFQKGWHTMGQVADLAGRAMSYMAQCFVTNACGTIGARMREELPVSAKDRAFLDDPTTLGGSSIISPTSRVFAGPLGPGEGILYADIELELAVRAKLTHDFAGHYNRPDVFQLRLNTEAPQILRREAWRNQAWRHGPAGSDSPGEARTHPSDEEEDCENPDRRDMS